jgi:hypothetical protein
VNSPAKFASKFAPGGIFALAKMTDEAWCKGSEKLRIESNIGQGDGFSVLVTEEPSPLSLLKY